MTAADLRPGQRIAIAGQTATVTARGGKAQPPLKPCMASGGRQQEKAYPTMTTTTPARACPVCEVYAAQTVPDSNWHAHHLMIHARQHPRTLDQAGRRTA